MSAAEIIDGHNQVGYGCNEIVCPDFFEVRFEKDGQGYNALCAEVDGNEGIPLHVSSCGEHRVSFFPINMLGIEVGCSTLAAKGFPWQLNECPNKVGDIKTRLFSSNIDLEIISE